MTDSINKSNKPTNILSLGISIGLIAFLFSWTKNSESSGIYGFVIGFFSTILLYFIFTLLSKDKSKSNTNESVPSNEIEIKQIKTDDGIEIKIKIPHKK